MSDQIALEIADMLKRIKVLENLEVPGTGTFIPTLFGSGTLGTFTYDTANTEAQYTRAFDRISFNGRLRITATTTPPTGNMSLGGLPIAAGVNAINGNVLGGAGVIYTGINLVAGYTQVQGLITGSSSSIALVETGDNLSLQSVQGGELAAAIDLYFWGMYKID